IEAVGLGLTLQRGFVGLVEPSMGVSIDGSLPESFRLAPLRAMHMPSSPQMASKRSQSSLLAHCTALPNRSAHDNTEIATSAPSRDSESRGYPFMASSPRTRAPTRRLPPQAIRWTSVPWTCSLARARVVSTPERQR